MSAPETGSDALRWPRMGQIGYEFRPKLGQVARKLTRRNNSKGVTRLVVGFSDHP